MAQERERPEAEDAPPRAVVLATFDSLGPRTAEGVAEEIDVGRDHTAATLSALVEAGELEAAELVDGDDALTAYYLSPDVHPGGSIDPETARRAAVERTIAELDVPGVSEMMQDWRRDALERAWEFLAEEGFVETSPGEHGGTLYRRSPESLVVEQAADILEHVTTDELVTRVTEMRERLNEYRTEYGVDSPEELAVERTNQTLSESGSAGQEIDPETVRDWKTLRRNLAFANAALSIGNAEQFVGEDDHSTDESIPA